MKGLHIFLHNGDSPTKRKCIYSIVLRLEQKLLKAECPGYI